MVVPLKNKTGPTLVEAFKVILTSGRKPAKIMTDQGTEFLNKHFRELMKEEDIELYNTYNETKASIVERLIRTLKTKINVALFYGQENHAIRRHVTRSGLFLQP
jgi:transposase InsO family protein